MTHITIHRQRNDDRRAVGLGSLTRGHHIPADGRQVAERFFPLFDASLLTGRRLRSPVLSHSRTAGGWCISQQRRADTLVPSRRGRPVKSSRSPLGCARRLPQHSACKLSDAVERHSSTPLSVVGFNANRHRAGEDEACSQSPVMRFSQ